MKRFNVFRSLAVLFLFFQIVWGLVPSVAEGAVPQLINFQGVLKDAAGNPPAVDMLDVTFTIYDDPLGGSALWTETLSITIADEGRFNVLLGSSNPIPDSVFKDTIRYLGIKVDTDPEMIPRQRLASVGYAYRVGTIDGASGGTINGAIDAPGMSSKIRFHFNDFADFPSPATYHGMFAHAHNQGAAYYAHAAQWVRLADSAHPHSSLAASDLDPNPALSVDADGNVGIGTTSPAKKLDVAGSIKTSDTLFASNVSSNSPLSLQAPAGSTRMYLDDVTGDVGIGTTSPAAKLHVASPGDVEARIENTSGVGYAQVSTWAGAVKTGLFSESGGTGGIGTNSNHPLYFRTNSLERMRITNGGNVGIGTANPNHKLSVAGNVIIGPTGFAQLSVNGNTDVNGKVLIGQFGTNPAAWLQILAPVSATSIPLFRAQETGLGGFLDITDGTIVAGQFIPTIRAEARGTGAGRYGLLLIGTPGEDQSDDAAVRIDGRTSVALVNAPVLSVANFGVELFRIGANGNVGIGTASPGASNLLELSSTTKGFVLPRMTKTERDAIASPVAGMMVYQTDNTPGLRVYNGTNWMRFTETAD